MRTHGIRATYVDGCRCRKCRHAEAVYNVERSKRAGKKARRPRPKMEYTSAPSWLEEAKCRGDDLFYARCCSTSKKEQLAYTAWLRAYCASCPVRVKCEADVLHWESFHPDDMRALFQAGKWPDERTVEARRRVARSEDADRAFGMLRGALGS